MQTEGRRNNKHARTKAKVITPTKSVNPHENGLYWARVACFAMSALSVAIKMWRTSTSGDGITHSSWLSCVAKQQSNGAFSSIVPSLPTDYKVLDLSSVETYGDPATNPVWTIGKYDEDRKALYATPMFLDTDKSIDGYAGQRTIHIGLDIGGPVMTPLTAFDGGRIFDFGVNPDEGDYGHVVVMEHTICERKVYALYGHLSARSLDGKVKGGWVEKGETIGFIGDENENGGWPVHVHFQLAMSPPDGHDMPGVVSFDDRAKSLIAYPDPRIVLGGLY
jgi:murein DD-endopeptidase MepM/ murein hydrolase activator NlpD